MQGVNNNLKEAAILKESIDRIKATIELGEIGDAAATICKRRLDDKVREWIKVINLEKTDVTIEDIIEKLNETKNECTRNSSEIKFQEECLAKFNDNPTIKGLYKIFCLY